LDTRAARRDRDAVADSDLDLVADDDKEVDLVFDGDLAEDREARDDSDDVGLLVLLSVVELVTDSDRDIVADIEVLAVMDTVDESLGPLVHF
jgi:hypothetical protein